MIIDIVHGFLGSGKTTFIQQLIKQLIPLEKVVILVNEFGQIGIDGLLLKKDGNEVVELSSGCICCTLKADLGRQIPEIFGKFSPDRLIIEPSGVATIKNVLDSLGSLRLEPFVQAVKVICVIDGEAFPDLLEATPLYVQSQMELADIVLINKCDLITEEEAGKIAETVRGINGDAGILLTSYGNILLDQLDVPVDLAKRSTRDGGASPRRPGSVPDTPRYQSFARQTGGIYSREALRRFFNSLARPETGEIIRAKGIFQAAGGWVRFDYLNGRVNEADIPEAFEYSRFVAIGHNLNQPGLAAGLARCVSPGGSGG